MDYHYHSDPCATMGSDGRGFTVAQIQFVTWHVRCEMLWPIPSTTASRSFSARELASLETWDVHNLQKGVQREDGESINEGLYQLHKW